MAYKSGGAIGLTDLAMGKQQRPPLSHRTGKLSAMSTVTFDTFKFVDRLEKAGMSREQAAAFAQAQQDSLAEALESTLATKADILRVENRLDLMGKDLQAMELRLTIKLGAFITATAGTTVALVKLL